MSVITAHLLAAGLMLAYHNNSQNLWGGGAMGPRGFARRSQRRGRRRGLIVGAAIGAAAANRGRNNEPGNSQVDAQDDVYAELEELAKLKDQGILTEEEFQAKKSQLLGL